MTLRFSIAFVLIAVAATSGCSHGPPQVAPAEPPAVPVSQPVERRGHRLRRLHRPDRRRRSRWTSAPASPATWSRCRSRKGPRSRRATCCSRSTRGPTRPSSTRPRARSTSTRPSSSWPRRPTTATARSTARSPGVDQPAAARPGPGRGRGGRGPGQGLPGEHRGLQAQPRVHQGHLADRRPGQPLLPDRSATWSTRTRRC